jgi:ribosomal protein S12 methylthiotransferase
MPEQLPEPVKQERYARLMETQQQVAFARAARRVGDEFDVVIDGRDEHGWVARHAGQAPEVDGVCRLARGRFEPGELVPVRCRAPDGYDLQVEPRRVRLPFA